MTVERERAEVALVSTFDSYLAGNMHTFQPGQVISFDRSNATAVVQPCFKIKYSGQDELVTPGQVQDVPVQFSGSADRWQTVDLKADSYVMLIFSQRAIATWFEQGGTVDPTQARKFSDKDAVAIPGLLPSPAMLSTSIVEDSIEFRNDDRTAYIALAKGGETGTSDIIELLVGTARIYMQGNSTEINSGTGTAVEYGRLKTAFDQLKSDFNALVVLFNAHIHTAVTPAPVLPSNVSGPTATPGTPSVANMAPSESDTVKIP